jgi:hypothetical protein
MGLSRYERGIAAYSINFGMELKDEKALAQS